MLNIHTHFPSPNAIYNPFDLTKISDTYSYISLGIHPWRLAEIDLNNEKLILEKLIAEHHSKLLAIGECGLDKTIDFPIQEQITIFKYQVSLSEKLQLPLIIHCVKAFNEIIALKKQLNPTQNWIIHDFRRNENIAKQLTEQNIYLSLSSSIFKVKKEVLTEYPLNYILFETDDKPIDIHEVFLYFAHVKKIKEAYLLNTINTTTKHLFNIQNEN